MFHILAQTESTPPAPTEEGKPVSGTELLDQAGEYLPWIETARKFLAEHAIDFAVKLVAALAVYIVGKWIASFVTGLLVRAMKKAKADEMLIRFGGNVCYGLLSIMVIIAALQTLGVDLTSLTAILAAAGFAVGMALQGSLGNFAAGIMLIVFKPFRVGDVIEAAGKIGSIQEIHLFSCIMRTGDNVEVIVPNGQITSGVISNMTRTGTRRIDMVIGCGYNDDLLAVKQFLIDQVSSDSRILPEPAPLVAVDELGDSSVNFVVRPWVKTEDYHGVRRDLTERIKLGFDQRGFTFPFPSRDLFMHSDAA